MMREHTGGQRCVCVQKTIIPRPKRRLTQLPGCGSVTVAAAVVPHHHAAVLLLLLLFEGLFYFGSLQAAIPANQNQTRVITKEDHTQLRYRFNGVLFFSLPLEIDQPPLVGNGRLHPVGKLHCVFTILPFS